jgi:hypothetical protein
VTASAAGAPAPSAPAASAPAASAADGARPAGPGPGADPGDAAAGHGYGLTGMRERAELLGGRLTTTPTATGFRVELWVPA